MAQTQARLFSQSDSISRAYPAQDNADGDFSAPLARIQAERLQTAVFWMELRVTLGEALPPDAKLKRGIVGGGQLGGEPLNRAIALRARSASRPVGSS